MAAIQSSTPPPIHYLIPLYPCFQLLDLAGPLDMLNLLSITPGSGLHGLTLTFVASSMDPVSIKPVSPKSGVYAFDPAEVSSPDTPDGILNRTFNQFILPDLTFDDYLERMGTRSGKPDLHPIDVVLIPGGMGTRINRIYTDRSLTTPITGSSDTGDDVGDVPGKSGRVVSNVADVISFIIKIHNHIRHSIITVCTGSDILAQTGLLYKRRATTNVMRFEYVAAKNPDVKWLKFRRWVKSTPEENVVGNEPSTTVQGRHPAQSESKPEDESESDSSNATRFTRPIYTSAGISAGIDVTLHFIAENFSLALARKAAKSLEYHWNEIGEGEIDPMYMSEEWQEHLSRTGS